MIKIAMETLGQERQAALPQRAGAAFIELVDEPAIVRVRALALLMGSRQIQVRLARQEIQPVAQSFQTTTDKRVNVIGRQIAEAHEEFEDFDITLGRVDGDCGAIAANDRIT